MQFLEKLFLNTFEILGLVAEVPRDRQHRVVRDEQTAVEAQAVGRLQLRPTLARPHRRPAERMLAVSQPAIANRATLQRLTLGVVDRGKLMLLLAGKRLRR